MRWKLCRWPEWDGRTVTKLLLTQVALAITLSQTNKATVDNDLTQL